MFVFEIKKVDFKKKLEKKRDFCKKRFIFCEFFVNWGVFYIKKTVSTLEYSPII